LTFFQAAGAGQGRIAVPPEGYAFGPTIEDTMLDAGDDIAGGVDWAAEKLDLFLARRKYSNKPNKTQAKVTQLVTYSEGGHIKTSTDFGVNLRLPNLEKRWQLRFTTYDEEEESRDLQQRTLRTAPRERRYGAGLAFWRKLGNVRMAFQPKLELKDPLEVSHVLRFESESETKGVRLRPRFELFARPDKGTGEYFGFDFVIERGKWEFSLRNEEEYRERGNFFRAGHGVVVDYAINDRRGVNMAVVTDSNNRPSYHLHDIRWSTGYGQVIYKDRLRYSVSPFLSFGKNRNFKGEAGITLNVTLIF